MIKPVIQIPILIWNKLSKSESFQDIFSILFIYCNDLIKVKHKKHQHKHLNHYFEWMVLLLGGKQSITIPRTDPQGFKNLEGLKLITVLCNSGKLDAS